MAVILHTRDGRFVGEGHSEFDRLSKQLKAQSEPRLLLHLHGGLVSYSKGCEIARRLDGDIGSDGRNYAALKTDGWATGYFVWESSFNESVENNHAELANNGLLRAYILRVAAWISGRLGFESLSPDEPPIEELNSTPDDPATILANVGADAAKVPLVEDLAEDQLADSELGRMLLDDPELQAMHSLVESHGLTAARPFNLDQSVWDHITARKAFPTPFLKTVGVASAAEWVLITRVVRAGLRVVRRILDGRDHGTVCTIVEELARLLFFDTLGAEDWKLMKGDTRDHFAAGGAGTRLLDLVRAIGNEKASVRLLVVGHSAGAVFAGHLVCAAAALPDNVSIDVILLNPAIRMDLAESLFVKSARRLNGIRVFTLPDIREAADDLDGTPFGKIYPRSLLYLISGILEFRPNSMSRSYPDAPLLGLQRHLGRNHKFDQLERRSRDSMLRLLGDNLIFAGADNGPGKRSDARTHGSIDSDSQTIESICHIARAGL